MKIQNKVYKIYKNGDKSKPLTRTILVLNVEAISITMVLTIQLATATTTIRPIPTTTIGFRVAL